MTLTPYQLATLAAERLQERLDIGDIVHDCVSEVMEEAGIDFDSDESWDLAMDVMSRIAITALD